jgi:hypothetical protein
MSEFLMSRPIFLPSGKGCFKLSTALFRFGRSDAHIVPLLYNPFIVYHVSEYPLFFQNAMYYMVQSDAGRG